jgi:parallel beta-helix repeat protein
VSFIGNTVKCSSNSLGTPSTFTATDLAVNEFTLATPNIQFTTSRRVRVSSTGTLPTGLLSNNEYWTRETATSGGQTSKVKLYNKIEDAIADTNAVDVSATGSGTHTMQPFGGGDAVDTHGGGDYIKIIGNFISGSTGCGINIECPNCEITGNTVLNSFSPGINVRNESDRNGRAIIANNTVMYGNTSGILVQQGTRGTAFGYTNVAVTGNVVQGNGRLVGMFISNAGIVIKGGSNSLRSVTVTGNSVSNSGVEGIYLEKVRGLSVTGNQLYGNTTIGISAMDVTFTTISGNSVQTATASTYNAIKIDATSLGLSNFNTVTGNTVGAQAGVPTGAAIQFGANTTNSSVIANVTGGYPTPVTLGGGAGNIQANNI